MHVGGCGLAVTACAERQIAAVAGVPTAQPAGRHRVLVSRCTKFMSPETIPLQAESGGHGVFGWGVLHLHLPAVPAPSQCLFSRSVSAGSSVPFPAAADRTCGGGCGGGGARGGGGGPLGAAGGGVGAAGCVTGVWSREQHAFFRVFFLAREAPLGALSTTHLRARAASRCRSLISGELPCAIVPVSGTPLMRCAFSPFLSAWNTAVHLIAMHPRGRATMCRWRRGSGCRADGAAGGAAGLCQLPLHVSRRKSFGCRWLDLLKRCT